MHEQLSFKHANCTKPHSLIHNFIHHVLNKTGWYISLTPGPWTTTMGYRNGLPEWTAKWTFPKLPTLKKKKKANQSMVVLIDNSEDSIKEIFLQRASERSQKLIH